MSKKLVHINNRELLLSNLEKVYWPQDRIRKADLIDYYTATAPCLLPHLHNRPFTLVRYPEGILGDFFYQKEAPEHAPEWVKRVRVTVDRGGKVINFVLCNDLPTLVWLANLGCIELHAWASRLEHLEQPDFAVFDLDPATGASFEDALEVALLIRGVLSEFGLTGYPKTSGSTGLHINVPIKPVHTWEEVKGAVEYVAKLLVKVYPERCTIERTVAKRAGKVYLDYLQNGRSKTMAFAYSLRPHPGAPVSTPVTWREVETGFDPKQFNICTIRERINKYGDLFSPVLAEKSQDLRRILSLC